MLKTYRILIEELKNYKNPKTKIQRMVTNKEIYPIAKGLYETNPNVNPFYLADPIYAPSYISFETALAYHNLIPERVYAITCASFDKQRHKRYNTIFGLYTYQDIPKDAFPCGVETIEEDGYMYRIATKEKALLDKLYSLSPARNMKEMRELLFEDLRINEFVLETFDKHLVNDLSELYHSRNVALFNKMLRKDKLYD